MRARHQKKHAERTACQGCYYLPHSDLLFQVNSRNCA
jgi:hypothetical protein